jgi:prolyl 4-hydroxylase
MDAAALTAEGKRLLGLQSEAASQSIVALDRAAHLDGGGEAAALVAVLAGAGAHVAQSWPMAIDYLTRSAELGWAPARAQLAMLSADRELAQQSADAQPPADIWARLRRSIDLRPWLAPVQGHVLSDSPSILTAEGFLPPAACDWLIRRAEGRGERAAIYDPETGQGMVDQSRTNTAATVDLSEWDLILLLAVARIGATLRVPLSVMEPTNFLHYEVGQQFRPHHDYLDPDEPGPAQDIARRGQRAWTFLVYLNDGFEGGETEFGRLGLRHKPARGGALWFHNLDGQGRPAPSTLHAGLPPTAGEKWILSQWVRQPPAG